MTRFVGGLTVVLSVVSFWTSTAWPIPITPETFGTLRSPVGFQLTATYPTTIPSGPFMIAFGPNPVTIGTFDDKGRVIGGDAVIMAFIDLGTAPVSRVVVPATNGLNNIAVTPDSPRAAGILNAAGFVIPPSLTGFTPEFPAGSAPLGAEGEMLLGLALLERANQPLSKAFGAVLQYRVQIGEFSGFIPGFYEVEMRFGGAAAFENTIPTPVPSLQRWHSWDWVLPPVHCSTGGRSEVLLDMAAARPLLASQ